MQITTHRRYIGYGLIVSVLNLAYIGVVQAGAIAVTTASISDIQFNANIYNASYTEQKTILSASTSTNGEFTDEATVGFPGVTSLFNDSAFESASGFTNSDSMFVRAVAGSAGTGSAGAGTYAVASYSDLVWFGNSARLSFDWNIYNSAVTGSTGESAQTYTNMYVDFWDNNSASELTIPVFPYIFETPSGPNDYLAFDSGTFDRTFYVSQYGLGTVQIRTQVGAGASGLAPDPGQAPDEPILPTSTGPDGFDFSFDVGQGGYGIDFPIYVDPPSAIGYEFTRADGSPNFASVTLPGGIGDDLFDVLIFDEIISDFVPSWSDIMAGDILNFLGDGVSAFRVLGIEESAMLDPTDPLAFAAGLTFTGPGSVSMNMLPIINEADDLPSPGVSEPNAVVLLGLGLALIGVAKRRAVTSKKELDFCS